MVWAVRGAVTSGTDANVTDGALPDTVGGAIGVYVTDGSCPVWVRAVPESATRTSNNLDLYVGKTIPATKY